MNIFDCCDSCDALLTAAEKASAPRFGQTLCDHCAKEYGAVNPATKPGVLAELLDRWETRSRNALPADAMLINKHIRELREVCATVERLAKTAAAAARHLKKHARTADDKMMSLALSDALAAFRGEGAPQ